MAMKTWPPHIADADLQQMSPAMSAIDDPLHRNPRLAFVPTCPTIQCASTVRFLA